MTEVDCNPCVNQCTECEIECPEDLTLDCAASRHPNENGLSDTELRSLCHVTVRRSLPPPRPQHVMSNTAMWIGPTRMSKSAHVRWSSSAPLPERWTSTTISVIGSQPDGDGDDNGGEGILILEDDNNPSAAHCMVLDYIANTYCWNAPDGTVYTGSVETVIVTRNSDDEVTRDSVANGRLAALRRYGGFDGLHGQRSV